MKAHRPLFDELVEDDGADSATDQPLTPTGLVTATAPTEAL